LLAVGVERGGGAVERVLLLGSELERACLEAGTDARDLVGSSWPVVLS
jgi:hypothetical protein